jgi:hypothetical protein
MKRYPLYTQTPPHLRLCVGSTLFPPNKFLEEHAEELGVVERDGKLQSPVLV